MERMSSRRPGCLVVAVTLLAAALVGSAVFGGGVAAVSESTDGNGDDVNGDLYDVNGVPYDVNDPTGGYGDEPAGSLTECFVGEGYHLSIGDPPTTIDAVVHLSVLTDAGAASELGTEIAGTTGDDRIVTIAAGVRLSRAGLLESGLNPFAAFDVLYTYELRLPMFDGAIGETTYEEEGSPVTSAAGVVPC